MSKRGGWASAVLGAVLVSPAVALAVDTDGDGLGDQAEILHGTDPTAWDSDADTVPDGAEVLVCGTDPLTDERTCAAWDATVITTLSDLTAL